MWRESKTKAHLKVWNSIWFALIVPAWHSVFQCVPVCSRVFQCVFHLLSYFLVEVLLPLTVNILLDKYLMKIWLITDNQRHIQNTDARTHTYTHIHTHEHKHAHTHANTHTYTNTHTRTHHTHKQTNKNTHIFVQTHIKTQKHIPQNTNTKTRQLKSVV